MSELRPICIGCNRCPKEIEEYSKECTESNIEPDDYVRQEEGTYNPHNGHFYCTECYVKADMPLGVAP